MAKVIRGERGSHNDTATWRKEVYDRIVVLCVEGSTTCYKRKCPTTVHEGTLKIQTK